MRSSLTPTSNRAPGRRAPRATRPTTPPPQPPAGSGCAPSSTRACRTARGFCGGDASGVRRSAGPGSPNTDARRIWGGARCSRDRPPPRLPVASARSRSSRGAVTIRTAGRARRRPSERSSSARARSARETKPITSTACAVTSSSTSGAVLRELSRTVAHPPGNTSYQVRMVSVPSTGPRSKRRAPGTSAATSVAPVTSHDSAKRRSIASDAGAVVIDGDRRSPVVDGQQPERPTHGQGGHARDELGGGHGLRLQPHRLHLRRTARRRAPGCGCCPRCRTAGPQLTHEQDDEDGGGERDRDAPEASTAAP